MPKWIYDRDGNAIPEEEYYAMKSAELHGVGLQIVRDIEPYKSVVTGEIIGSRSAHRRHLSSHGLTEVGNERLSPKKHEPMPSARRDLIESLQGRRDN